MTVRALARINLAAIERNCAKLVARSPRLCAVVKADAYGHGAVACAKAALGAGAASLAVAAPDEARELRRGGIVAPILVMGALTRAELAQALGDDADVVAWSDEFLDWVIAAGSGRVHIKLDSGMGRLGTRDGVLADAGERGRGQVPNARFDIGQEVAGGRNLRSDSAPGRGGRRRSHRRHQHRQERPDFRFCSCRHHHGCNPAIAGADRGISRASVAAFT